MEGVTGQQNMHDLHQGRYIYMAVHSVHSNKILQLHVPWMLCAYFTDVLKINISTRLTMNYMDEY